MAERQSAKRSQISQEFNHKTVNKKLIEALDENIHLSNANKFQACEISALQQVNLDLKNQLKKLETIKNQSGKTTLLR